MPTIFKSAIKVITSFIVLVLAFSNYFLLDNAYATFGECAANTACMFKDIYDFNTNTWVQTSANGNVGDQMIFNIGFWNRKSSSATNVTFKDTLPAGLTFVPGTVIFAGYGGAFTEANLFNGTGINVGTVASNGSVQVQFIAKVAEQPVGAYNLINTGTVVSSFGTSNNTASVTGTSTGPTAGKILINEIDSQPRADWSDGGEYRLSGRTAIDNADQFIEFYVKQAGLNLTTADWTYELTNTPSAPVSGQLLSLGATVQYVSTSGGTTSNTKVGDYLLIGNTTTDLTNNMSLKVKYLGVDMDSMSFNSSNTNLLDETIGRNATSTDTDSNGDFTRNHGTPGRANTTRVANTYEAEIYMGSSTGNEHGVDIFDSSASDGIGVSLNGSDLDGDTFVINSQNETAAGHYRITLRAKIDNNSGNIKVGDFFVFYPNARGARTGFQITSKDFSAANTYRDFVIEIAKPSTPAQDNIYTVAYTKASGRTLIIDKVIVSTFSAWNSTDCPSGVCTFEAENYFTKTGSFVNDGTASNGKAVFTTGASIVTPTTDHAFFGPYSATFIDLGSTQGLKAVYRLKFTNITAPNPSDRIARLEVTNPFPNQRTTLDIYKQDVPNGNYNDYTVNFISSLEGSYQMRVIDNGNTDIYIDKVAVSAAAGAQVIYESESYNGISGLIGTKVTDGLAANGFAMSATTAGSAGWIQASAPSYTDFIGSDQYLKATFSLRSAVASPSDISAADIKVYHHALNGIRTLLTSMSVSGKLLTNANYRDFDLIFKAPSTGTLSYRIYFKDAIDIFADRVTVQATTVSNPKVRQAEYFRALNNSIVTDALASANAGQNNNHYAVFATGNSTLWLLQSGPNEAQPSGTYNITYYLRKSSAGGSPANTMGKIQVKDPVTGLVVAEKYVQETDISDSSYTAVTVPSFAKATNGRLDTRFVYYGSLTTMDIYIDRVEITRVGGF